jgi:hypothetical protein
MDLELDVRGGSVEHIARQGEGNPSHQIARGLADYGHKTLAADIADKTVANAIKNGINEHHDSVSGKGIGVKDYCMSCTLLTMMLDGLTQKYKLRLRHEPRGQ